MRGKLVLKNKKYYSCPHITEISYDALIQFKHILSLLLFQQRIECASITKLLGGALAFLVVTINLGWHKPPRFFLARWQSGNAAVCKTVPHRFESGPSLHSFKWHNKLLQPTAKPPGLFVHVLRTLLHKNPLWFGCS